MSNGESELTINPEDRKLNLEKKYPQDEKELLLELDRIWKKVQENMTSGKTGYNSEIIIDILGGTKMVMEEAVKAFNEGDRATVREHLNTLRDMERNISSPKSEVKIPEMELKIDERKEKFHQFLSKIQEKSEKFVKILLDKLKKDFETAINSGDLEEERRCWNTLKSFQDVDLTKIEKLMSEIKEMLDKPLDNEDKEDWE